MAVPQGSLKTFLQLAKTTLQDAIKGGKPVNIISGNESADLDSIFSSILLAYIRSSSPPVTPTAGTPASQAPFPTLFVPLLNIPRADVEIRPELLKVLPYADLQPSDLITLDDLQAHGPNGTSITIEPATTRILLVDHNSLDGPLLTKGFKSSVIGWIDHHVDEDTPPKAQGRPGDEPPKTINLVGSCSSLVTNYCQPYWDALSKSALSASGRQLWDAQVAHVAIAPALVDTGDLKNDKTRNEDREAVPYLVSKINAAPVSITSGKFDQSTFFEEVKTAKEDVGHLTIGDILRKDYKQFTVADGRVLGISSSVKGLKWLVKQAGGVSAFEKAVMEFAQAPNRNLDFCTIMSASKNDGTKMRELFLWSIKPQGNNFVETFASKHGDYLQLSDWKEVQGLGTSNHTAGEYHAWWQAKTEYSRKQVAPLLRDALNAK